MTNMRRNTATPIDALRLRLTALTRFGGPFLAGPAFTAVDAFFAPVVFRIQTYGLEMASPAPLYVDHMLALPAMRDWYAAALSETWRDAEHEQMARNAGTWLNDYRAADL